MSKRDWYIQRWKNLGDVTELLKAAAPNYQDPSVYLQRLILDETNPSLAEKRLKILEDLKLETIQEKLDVFLQEIRYKRDELLLKSDFSQLPDVPLTSEQKKQYREYRQYLRDLPKHIETSKRLDVRVRDFKDWKEHREKTKYSPHLEL